jgi:hypothetical protein
LGIFLEELEEYEEELYSREHDGERALEDFVSFFKK